MGSESTDNKALLVGLQTPKIKKWEAIESLEELHSLAKTAGLNVAGEAMALVRQISSATFIGLGKIYELKERIKLECFGCVLFDSDLSPSQARNLEKEFGIRVIDRTALILDIFALHAKSKEGKLQVELAQYQYLYPRLVGAWTHLSKQRGGGVGLRGPGETQLEVDRRRVKERMATIKQSLKKVESSRSLHRKKRQDTPIPTVSLIGYTNAGKSTLFNFLTRANEIAEDKLFATLDPKTKKIKLPSAREILLTDTVGFIRNLPHQLIEAFMSTFEEAKQSNLLIHVIDAAHPYCFDRVRVVEGVLKDLKLDEIPLIHALNKMDMVAHEDKLERKNVVPISALTGQGIDDLLKMVDKMLSNMLTWVTLFLPHDSGNILSQLYQHGHVYQVINHDDGTQIDVALPQKWHMKFKKYILDESKLVQGRVLIT